MEEYPWPAWDLCQYPHCLFWCTVGGASARVGPLPTDNDLSGITNHWILKYIVQNMTLKGYDRQVCLVLRRGVLFWIFDASGETAVPLPIWEQVIRAFKDLGVCNGLKEGTHTVKWMPLAIAVIQRLSWRSLVMMGRKAREQTAIMMQQFSTRRYVCSVCRFHCYTLRLLMLGWR